MARYLLLSIFFLPLTSARVERSSAGVLSPSPAFQGRCPSGYLSDVDNTKLLENNREEFLKFASDKNECKKRLISLVPLTSYNNVIFKVREAATARAAGKAKVKADAKADAKKGAAKPDASTMYARGEASNQEAAYVDMDKYIKEAETNLKLVTDYLAAHPTTDVGFDLRHLFKYFPNAPAVDRAIRKSSVTGCPKSLLRGIDETCIKKEIGNLGDTNPFDEGAKPPKLSEILSLWKKGDAMPPPFSCWEKILFRAMSEALPRSLVETTPSENSQKVLDFLSEHIPQFGSLPTQRQNADRIRDKLAGRVDLLTNTDVENVLTTETGRISGVPHILEIIGVFNVVAIKCDRQLDDLNCVKNAVKGHIPYLRAHK